MEGVTADVNSNTKTQKASNPTEINSERMFFNLLERVGSFGIYQKTTLIFWSLACYLCGGLSFITPFLFFQDPYSCSSLSNSKSCQEYVCSLPNSQRLEFLQVPSLITLADKMGDYRCSDEASTLSLAILIMYLSAIFAFLILTLFGDLLGRKKVIVIGLIVMILGLIVTIFSPFLFVAAAGMFIALSGVQWAFSISFMFISETVAQSHRQQFLVIVQFFYGLGILGNTGLFYWLGDWQKVIIFFYIVPGVLLLLGVMIVVVDTPICLLRKLKSEKVLEQLLWIGKINKIENPQLSVENIESLKQIEKTRESQDKEAKHFNCIDLFRYPSLRSITIFLTLIQIALNFLFYAPTLMLADFEFSIFLNGVVIGAASAVSYIFSYFTINRIKRKTMAVFSFAAIFVVSFTLIFVWDSNGESLDVKANIAILICFFIITLLVTVQYTFFYVYITELFPTQVRVLGYSMVTVLGGVTIAVSDMLITLAKNSGFSVMIIFAFFALLSLFVSCGLDETFKKPSPDVVYEISQRIISLASQKKLSSKQANPETPVSNSDLPLPSLGKIFEAEEQMQSSAVLQKITL